MNYNNYNQNKRPQYLWSEDPFVEQLCIKILKHRRDGKFYSGNDEVDLMDAFYHYVETEIFQHDSWREFGIFCRPTMIGGEEPHEIAEFWMDEAIKTIFKKFKVHLTDDNRKLYGKPYPTSFKLNYTDLNREIESIIKQGNNNINKILEK